MMRSLQPRNLKHTLNRLQQAVVQPAMSALASKARAAQTSLHDVKSLLQTRRL